MAAFGLVHVVRGDEEREPFTREDVEPDERLMRSIEEKIVRLHRSKRDLAEGILSGEEAAAPIDAAQLMELLKAQ